MRAGRKYHIASEYPMQAVKGVPGRTQTASCMAVCACDCVEFYFQLCTCNQRKIAVPSGNGYCISLESMLLLLTSCTALTRNHTATQHIFVCRSVIVQALPVTVKAGRELGISRVKEAFMALIKLTEWDLNSKTETEERILLNSSHVMTVRIDRGKTEIVMSDGRKVYVFENPDLIYDMVKSAK